MLEILNKQAVLGPDYLPNSGPGPKRLAAGTETFGYFGRVPDGELGLGPKLSAGVPLSSSYFVDRPTTNMWAKFIRNGVTLYIPHFPFGIGTFAQIYTQRAYYSVLLPANEMPNFPMMGRAQYTAGRTFTANDGSVMLVRNLLDRSGVKFITYTGNDPVGAGEVQDLIIRAYAPGVTNPYGFKLPVSELEPAYQGQTPEVWCQHMSHDSNQAITTIISPTWGNFGKYLIGGSSKLCIWFPVLQYIPPDQVPSLPT